MKLKELIELMSFKEELKGYQNDDDVVISSANIDELLITARSMGELDLEIDYWVMLMLVNNYVSHLPLSEKRADIIAKGEIPKYLGVNIKTI